MSLSATARVTGHSRNTVARWLERASTAATRFNDRMVRGFDFIELQADELCTFVGNKHTTVWLCATIEVSSRLWAWSVLGRRSDHNARAVINDVVRRGRVVGCPLFATDGFKYYLGAVGDRVVGVGGFRDPEYLARPATPVAQTSSVATSSSCVVTTTSSARTARYGSAAKPEHQPCKPVW